MRQDSSVRPRSKGVAIADVAAPTASDNDDVLYAVYEVKTVGTGGNIASSGAHATLKVFGGKIVGYSDLQGKVTPISGTVEVCGMI